MTDIATMMISEKTPELLDYKGTILLPPSPNWFLDGVVDSREADRLLVAACFKTIIVYRIEHGEVMPVLLKSISHSYGKVFLVKLFPYVNDEKKQNLLLASGEYGDVTVYDAELGHMVGQLTEHNGATVGGLNWVTMEDNSIQAVSVDNNGVVCIWDTETNLTKTHKFPVHVNSQSKYKNNTVALTVIEPVPQEKGRILIAVDKDICYYDLKNGTVLSYMRGHSNPVYNIRWCPMEVPFVADNPDPIGNFGSNKKPGRSNNSTNWRGSNNWREKTPTSDNGFIQSQSTSTESTTNATEKSSSNYFVSSDVSGHIYLWDFNSRRYVFHTLIENPKKPVGKKRVYTHVALTWYKNKLLCGNHEGDIKRISFLINKNDEISKVDESSVEVMQDKHADINKEDSEKPKIEAVKKIKESDEYKEHFSPVHHEHNRVIFTINIIGSTVISTSQDRNLVGYCMDRSKVSFNIPTIGSSINSIVFNPHMSNWFGLGLQDSSIKLVDIQGTPPIKSKTISTNLKGRVLSMSWHPQKDNLIAVGTGDGQVGVVDAYTLRAKTYSCYHQRPVYNVCWAPKLPIASEKVDNLPMYVYSFGDRDVMMRNPTDFMANPVKLSAIITDIPSNVSEFSFSHDYKYLACGCQDGEVYIIGTAQLKIILKLVLIRKGIQHIIWKPIDITDESKSKLVYSIAIASNDNKICIQDLDSLIASEEQKMKESLESYKFLINSSCTRELIGHAGRVVYLAFSPHNNNLLASASYDHTCQVWHTSTGEQLGNYRGHLSRTMRVIFSPDQPGLLYSFSEDAHLHQWRLNNLEHKSPPNKINKPFDLKAGPSKSNNKSDELIKVKTSDKKRPPAHKSLFPLLHRASAHKRRFLLLSALSLNNHKIDTLKANPELEEDIPMEQLMNGEFDDKCGESVPSSVVSHYNEVVSSNQMLAENEENNSVSTEDAEIFLDFYGPALQIKDFLSKQISYHASQGNIAASSTLHCWQGSTEQLIKSAIAEKKLTADMVALTPQISNSLWLTASEAYAYQLSDKGEALMAANYLLNGNNVEGAVEILLKHKFFREALTLAKIRLPYSDELHKRVTKIFADVSIADGHYDMAVVLYASIGEADIAATTLCHKDDSDSLYVAALLYQQTQHPNTDPIFLECLKTCGSKLEVEKISSVLTKAPQFQWFKTIEVILELLVVKPHIVVSPSVHMITPGPVYMKNYYLDDNEGKKSVVQMIDEKLLSEELIKDVHYDEIVKTLSTSVKPTSPKTFWYLVSVELTKLILSTHIKPSDSICYVQSLNRLMQEWGRTDDVHNLTHSIMPAGFDNIPQCLKELLSNFESSDVQLFRQLYCISELHSRSTELLSLPSIDVSEVNDEPQYKLAVTQFIEFMSCKFQVEFASSKAYTLPEGCQLANIELFKRPREMYAHIVKKLVDNKLIPSHLAVDY